jgi:hypothetical protein
MGYLAYAADLATELQAMAARRIRLDELDEDTPGTVGAVPGTAPAPGRPTRKPFQQYSETSPPPRDRCPARCIPHARVMRSEPTGTKEWTVAVDPGTTLDALVELLCDGVHDHTVAFS